MDLLILAIIAIYFVYKLNNALGNKSFSYDNQKNYNKEFSSEDLNKEQPVEKIIDAKMELTDEEAIINQNPVIAQVLKNIRNIDKTFIESTFIKNASAAFEIILNAFTQNDKKTLQILLANNIYQEFVNHIEEKERKQIIVEQSLVTLKNVEIVKGKIEDKKAYLTLKYLSDQIYVVKDKEQNILEGDSSRIISKVDLWTFTKNLSKSEPVWELIATE